MARANQFKKELENLFARRASNLIRLLEKPKRGITKSIKKTHVRRAIKRLQKLASDALAKDLAKKEFENGVRKRKSWKVSITKGWGYKNKKKTFKKWYLNHINTRNCIYVFWKKRKCIYVGKTVSGPGRITSHFVKRWFSGVTRIDVYESRGKRYLPALECIAIHRFQPKENASKAETKKWTRKCPLCEIHKNIEYELKSIFRLR